MPEALVSVPLVAHGLKARILLPDPSDHIQRIIQGSGNFYEEDLLEDIYGRVPRGTAIDVGAHIGNHTIWFAVIMRMKVLALEPNPKSYAALLANCRHKRASALVTALNVAAGETTGVVEVVDQTPGNSGMAVCRDAPSGTIQRVRIDDIAQDLTDVTLIKVDVEGDEIAVLKGAAATIAAHRPMIYAEAATPEAELALEIYMSGMDYKRFGVWGRTKVFGYCPAERLPVRRGALSVAIMAHPARAELIPALLTRLDHPAAVVLDHHDDRWETGRRALLAYDPSCARHLVIQDDAVIPLDLIGAINAVTQVPADAPMALFTGNVPRFLRHIAPVVGPRTSWLTMPGVNWGVALIIPTADIPALVAFGDERPEPNYDMRISRYYESLGATAGIQSPLWWTTAMHPPWSPAARGAGMPGASSETRPWPSIHAAVLPGWL